MVAYSQGYMQLRLYTCDEASSEEQGAVSVPFQTKIFPLGIHSEGVRLKQRKNMFRISPKYKEEWFIQ